jgi:hypothetical protein
LAPLAVDLAREAVGKRGCGRPRAGLDVLSHRRILGTVAAL